jgi:F-type H+-transporting ATPase subunit b
MQSLNKKHDEMMAQAKNERDALLAEARKVSEEMYEKAKLKASAESQAMIEDAKKAIYFEKMKAITDAKNAIANFSIDIAQKVITEELKDREKQEALVEKWLEDCHFN